MNYVHKFYIGGNGATAVGVVPTTAGEDTSMIRLVGLGTWTKYFNLVL